MFHHSIHIHKRTQPQQTKERARLLSRTLDILEATVAVTDTVTDFGVLSLSEVGLKE